MFSLLMILNIKEILYHCTCGDDHRLTICRGRNGGDVLAIANPYVTTVTNDRQTNIDFADSQFTIEITENPPKGICRPIQNSRFSFNDSNYHWVNHKRLLEDQSNHTIARFHRARIEGRHHKVGHLDIFQNEMQDIIVVTALVVKERSNEHKSLVLESLFFLIAKVEDAALSRSFFR